MAAPNPIPEVLKPFRLDPEREADFIEAISSPNTSLQDVATAWNTTVGALCLFFESDAGFDLLGGLEAVMSMRLRVAALGSLPVVITTLTTIVKDCPGPEATASTTDFPALKLIEFKRNNARRAGTLLFRMATYHPRAPRRAAITSAQPCGTSKRPLGRGEASASAVGSSSAFTSHSASAGARSPVSPSPAMSVPPCGTPKRPPGRGEVVAPAVGFASQLTSPTASSARATTASRTSSLATLAGSAIRAGP